MGLAFSTARSLAKSRSHGLAGGTGIATPSTPFVATPSTATPVAGVDVTWTTNATDFGTPVLYMWDFGDGTIPVTGATPSHFFVGLGPYTVSVTVTYDDDSTKTGTIVITPVEENVVTLTNEPYKPGTDLGSLTTWQQGGGTRTATANAAVAPDGTTTADEFLDGTGFIQKGPISVTADSDVTVVAYFKDVNRRYVFLACYSPGFSTVGFDLQTGEMCWSQVSDSTYKLRGASINAIGSGWYRCSLTIQVPSDFYLWMQPSNTNVGGVNAGGPATYDGTGSSFYVWGVNWFAGKDTYDPNFDYLGAIQTPAPTSTLESPLPATNMKRISYESFSALLGPSDLGGFDAWFGSFNTLPVPVGAKLAAEDGVGWSGVGLYDASTNWAGQWTVQSLHAMYGCWVHFDALPEGTIKYISIESGSGSNRIFSVDSSGNIKSIIDGSSSTIKAGGVVANGDYWFGLAVSGSQCVFLLKEIGSAMEVLSTTTAVTGRASHDVYVGPDAASATAHHSRVSAITRHWLRSIDDAAYPNEIVPPQDENFIYTLNPATGDDANNGVDAPWQTIARVNDMFGPYGVISTYTPASNGSGCHLILDTSGGELYMTTTPLLLQRDGTWIKRLASESFMTIRPYTEIDPGDWTATGGYSNIWEIPYTEDEQTTVSGDNIPFERGIDNIADLAALDAAAGGASWVDTTANKLHVKTLNLTDPRSDGITYRHGHLRAGDPTGYPVIALGCASPRVTGLYTRWTANQFNGSYAIGDVDGFSEGCLVEDCDVRYGDKHLICWTSQQDNTTITVRNCRMEQSWSMAMTDFMITGTGNIHNWEDCRIDVSSLLARSANGINYDYINGAGAYYSHGAGNVYAEVNFLRCQIGGAIVFEADSATLVQITDCVVDHVNVPSTLAMTGTTMSQVPSFYAGSITASTLTCDSVAIPSSLRVGGAITNSELDFRNTGYVVLGIWAVIENPLTFTGNTVRFNAGNASPLFRDCAAADWVACDNNTYIGLGASDVLIKDYDDGSTVADRTFAQWQALGYDAASTRIDP